MVRLKRRGSCTSTACCKERLTAAITATGVPAASNTFSSTSGGNSGWPSGLGCLGASFLQASKRCGCGRQDLRWYWMGSRCKPPHDMSLMVWKWTLGAPCLDPARDARFTLQHDQPLASLMRSLIGRVSELLVNCRAGMLQTPACATAISLQRCTSNMPAYGACYRCHAQGLCM